MSNVLNYSEIGGGHWVVGGTLEIKDGATFTVDDQPVALGALAGLAATSTEINSRVDDSAMVETIAAAGALSTTAAVSLLATAAGGAVTLAVPTKPAMIKIIKMTADNGDVTLALTNVVGGSQAATATFSAVGQTLVLVSDVASGKWVVLKEQGVVLT